MADRRARETAMDSIDSHDLMEEIVNMIEDIDTARQIVSVLSRTEEFAENKDYHEAVIHARALTIEILTALSRDIDSLVYNLFTLKKMEKSCGIPD